MSHDFIARFKIQTEYIDKFVALIAPMEENSRQEPGTLGYKFYRLEEASWFAVFESFVDEAADLAHQENPANEALIAEMITYMDGGYTREFLLPVEGEN